MYDWNISIHLLYAKIRMFYFIFRLVNQWNYSIRIQIRNVCFYLLRFNFLFLIHHNLSRIMFFCFCFFVTCTNKAQSILYFLNYPIFHIVLGSSFFFAFALICFRNELQERHSTSFILIDLWFDWWFKEK